jgi:hypothetical protein
VIQGIRRLRLLAGGTLGKDQIAGPLQGHLIGAAQKVHCAVIVKPLYPVSVPLWRPVFSFRRFWHPAATEHLSRIKRPLVWPMAKRTRLAESISKLAQWSFRGVSLRRLR